jgi:hypothetical protein
MPATLVQICPPGTGGVRDYAEALARAWAARGVPSQVLEGTREALGAQLDALPSPGDPDDRLRLVLHFSAYGYAPRGLCGWLADELARLKATHGSRVWLVVVFHELFAGDEPVWRSAFWLAPHQARAARRIATLADSLWTNTARHAAWLREVVDDAKPLQAWPVFSNVGEPADVPAWITRRPAAVVFGSAGTRQRAFDALRGQASALARLGIREIVEVGDGHAAPEPAPGLPRRVLGRLSASELSRLLSASRFALIDYPASYLGKSGVFAAYAANGCVVVNLRAPDDERDDVREGVHFIDLRAAVAPNDDALAQMAQRLHRWYHEHPLASQARQLLAAAEVDVDARRSAPPALAAAPR